MVSIGIFFKLALREREQILKELNKWEAELGFQSEELESGALLCHAQNYSTSARPSHRAIDFILCFGGDGTMLHSVEYSLLYDAPVLGVNFGKIGFLSDTSLKELKRSVSNLVNEKYRLENRMLLDVQVIRAKKKIFHGIALNEAVLFKACNSKLVNIRLYANRQFVYETRSDGLVISTPTGSTAYSLSAGGPIISPAMQAIIVTPLNPHILTVRPMVFDESETIEVLLPFDQHIYLQTDGNSRCELKCLDKIIIKKATQTIKFVKLTQKTFYRILRRKLQMGKI